MPLILISVKHGNKSSQKKETEDCKDIYLLGSNQETSITSVIRAGRFHIKSYKEGINL